MAELTVKIVSSLEKVMLESESFFEIDKATCLKNERYSFQIAYKSNLKEKIEFTLECKGDLSAIDIRIVGNVPSELPAYGDNVDDDYIKTTSGLFPDPLYPLETYDLYAMPNKWHSIWVTVDSSLYESAGIKSIEFAMKNKEFDICISKKFTLEVINAFLPKQKLVFTQWLHLDCIADINKTRIFSKKHWQLIEQNIKVASKCGVNMILIPLFTPPLDTAVGSQRPTVQLVTVGKSDNVYSFDFKLLKKYIDILRVNGIEYFEFSHLFTQWGAEYTPKIIVEENNKKHKKFGWNVKSSSEEYNEFLCAFLPELVSFIKREKIEKKVYFHISDEPNKEHIKSYSDAKNIIAKHLNGFKIIDAMSDVEFYKTGLIQIPVVSTTHIDKFFDFPLKERWTYYCCGDAKEVSNRFFAMPSYRNRILGSQLYKFKIKGFLHWGFNFYYSQFSKRLINPYLITDCECAFPSGDAFLVYPYKDTVIESIRSVVFYEGLQDMRALELLENLTSKEETITVMENIFNCELTFKKYPKSVNSLLELREDINNRIKKLTI